MSRPALRREVLGEWDRRVFEGVQLTESDRRLVSRLTQSNRVSIREIPPRLEIETKGWIGVIRLQALTLSIEPRLIDGHATLVRLLEFVRGIKLLDRLSLDAPFLANGEDLFDLVAWLLSDACDDVIRIGVQADYVPQCEELPTIRGRLDLRAQYLRRWGQVDRLVCDFDERVREIPENQWLVRALGIARRRTANPEVRARVKRSASVWEEICLDDLQHPLPHPALSRSTQHYRAALDLAHMVLDNATVADLLAGGSTAGFSFLLNMPRLFEEFVAAALEKILVNAPVTVTRQASTRSIPWDPDANGPYGTVRPDVLIHSVDGTTCLPVDAKYKDYDNTRLQPADLYQAAIYALALARAFPSFGPKSCVLLYPATNQGMQTKVQRVQVRTGDSGTAEVTAVGVPVARMLNDLRGSAVDYTREDWCSVIAGRVPLAKHPTLLGC